MELKVLFFGDIVGEPGRDVLRKHLPALLEKESPDFLIANAENAAGGSGVTESVANELFALRFDVLTSGDHIYKRKESYPFLERDPRVLRPANYPKKAIGRGWTIRESRPGLPIAVVNLQGRVFMDPVDCPFAAVDELLEQIRGRARVVIVDMHAEATSEKVAMGWYLDGRVSAVVGSHTHIQTADERVLPKGTAYLTDLGMTGAYRSVLGRQVDRVLHRFTTQMPAPFDLAHGDEKACGCLLRIDSDTGRATGIRRIVLGDGEDGRPRP
jgi:metallophosphoesterase (TIGR00282 family)